jgi:hypothetical protein
MANDWQELTRLTQGEEIRVERVNSRVCATAASTLSGRETSIGIATAYPPEVVVFDATAITPPL